MGIDYTALAARPGERRYPRLVRQRPPWMRIAFFVSLLLGITFAVVGVVPSIAYAVRAEELDSPPLRLFAQVLGACSVIAIAAMIAVAALQRRWTLANRELVTSTVDKLPAFAHANGWRYTEREDAIPFRHDLFDTPYLNPRLLWVLRVTEPREVVVATFVRDVPQQGGSVHPLSTAFAAVRLDRPMPHVLVEPRSNLLPGLAADQRLSLEGDFDRHFSVFAAEGAEVEALTMLTPDVMAALIDDAGLWSIEVVDDWLLLVPPFTSFGVLGPDDWPAALETVGVVSGEIVQQTDRAVGGARGLPTATVRRFEARGPAGTAMRRATPLSGRLVLGTLSLVVLIVSVVVLLPNLLP